MAGHGEPILYSLYVYAPNKAAPIFFAVAYGLSAVFHIWQCFHYKAWRLLGLHPLCAVLFTAGYALREYGAYNYLYSETDSMPLIMFILSQVFIYVCPPLLELANYHVLGRVLGYIPHLSPLPPNRVLRIFGGIMMLVEALNALGVALSANPSSSAGQQSTGKYLTVAAIAIQVAVIAVFVVLAAFFHVRCARAFRYTTAASASASAAAAAATDGDARPRSRWKAAQTVLLVLYASMALIFARCVYRLVEHTGNTHVELDEMEALRGLSPLLRYEAYFYAFEASLMLVNSWLWNVWHPRRFLPVDRHVYLDRNGAEVVGEEQEDRRMLLEKTANVLTFGILFRAKNGEHRRMDSVELS